MFKTLLATEFNANKLFLWLSAIGNSFMFIVLSTAEEPDAYNFIAGTMVLFYIQLIVLAISVGEQKRYRLYAQLPVTSTATFLVGWIFVLGWLFSQSLLWILFSLVWSPENTITIVDSCFAIATGMAIVIAMVSIGINMMNFRPRFWLWLYLAAVAILLVLSSHLEANFGVITSGEGIRLFPFMFLGDANGGNPVTWLIAIALFVSLFFADHWVFKNSDNYLG